MLCSSNPGANLQVAAFCYWTLLFGIWVWLLLHLINLPLRREERARFFLDFLAQALRRGMPVEQAIIGASQSRDPALNVRFHLLATWLEKGFTLSEALDKTPGLLPPAILSFLRIGERTGNLARVLVDCRDLASGAGPQFLKAQNYLALAPLCLTTIGLLWLVPLLLTFVAPKFFAIATDFGISDSGYLEAILHHAKLYAAVSISTGVCLLLFMLPIITYIGGPSSSHWLLSGLPKTFDRLLLWLPWYRHRCERSFTGALSALLDAQIPESESVVLAGQCTGNLVCQRRAEEAAQRLSAGEPLARALSKLSQEPEFHWRLANACASPTGFTASLRGWQEALEAKAFQLEQTFVQATSTGLVLINGLLVAALAIAFFQMLILMIDEAALW
jgi:type II secretory pathway component PulF